VNVAVRPARPRGEGAWAMRTARPARRREACVWMMRAVGLAGRREECAVRTACPRREAA
jgi:hypothetical protein